MVKTAIQKITAWSYSRFRDYKKCPQLAKFKFIDKLKEPEGPALVRGKACHDTLQLYVEGKVTTLPKELLRHEVELKQLRKKFKKGKIHCEQQWAFNDKWETVDWFAADCWLRVKMDVCEDAGLKIYGIDYKTGKFRPGEYNDQMLQYCAAMLLKFPKAQEAHIKLMFFDVEAEAKSFLKRIWLNPTLEKMKAAVEPMLNDTRFAPTPGDYCRWCPFSKKKDGPCKVA